MPLRALFLVLCALGVSARDIYVGLDGIDVENCGLNRQAKCKTIRYAIQTSAWNDVIRVDPTRGAYINETASDYTAIQHTLLIIGENVTTHGRATIQCQKTGTFKLYNVSDGDNVNRSATLTLQNLQIRACSLFTGHTDPVITASGGYIKIFNGKFINNGLLLHHSQDIGNECKKLRLFVANSSFSSNTISKPYQPGLSLLGCRSVQVSIINTTFVSTAIKLQAFQEIKVDFYNVSLDGRNLRGRILDLTASNMTFISLSHSSVTNHHGSGDSTVSIAIYQPPSSTNIHFKHVTFTENVQSKGNGAALSIIAPFRFRHEEDYNINAELTNCIFINNSAAADGGALYIKDVNMIQLNQCTFRNNTAYNGGAVFVDAVRNLTIINSMFEGNTAQKDEHTVSRAGALYAERSDVDLQNVSFINNQASSLPSTMLVFASDLIKIQQSFFQTFKRSESDLQNNMFLLNARKKPNNLPNIILRKNNFSMTNDTNSFILEANGHIESRENVYKCPKGLNGSKVTIEAEFVSDKFDFTKLVVFCKKCPEGMFDPSQYIDSTFASESRHYCLPCPQNVICRGGQAKARRNYWGRSVSHQANKSDINAEMILCPPGLCCQDDECQALDSCPPLHEGIMCSKCSGNRTIHLARNECIEDSDCKTELDAVILSLALCLAVFVLWLILVVVVMKLTEHTTIDSTDEPLLSAAGGEDTQPQSGFSQVEGPELVADDDDLDENLLSSNTTTTSNFPSNGRINLTKNIIGGIILTILYCQVVPLVLDIHMFPEVNPTVKEISDILTNIMSFRFPFQLFDNLCSLFNLGRVGRVIYNLIECWILWAVFMLFYIIAMCIAKCRERLSLFSVYTSKVSIYFGMLLAFLLITLFLPQISQYAKLFHCVRFDKNVILYIDASVICDDSWRVSTIIYVSVSLAPLWMTIIHGSALLRQCTISMPQFVLAVIFPFPFIIFWYIKYGVRPLCSMVTNRYSRRDEILNDLQYDNVRLSPGSKSVLAVFHGPFNGLNSKWHHFHWLPCYMYQNFTLVLISTFISHVPVVRSFILVILTFCYLALQQTIKPFGTAFLNMFQTFLLTNVCILSILGVYGSLVYTSEVMLSDGKNRMTTLCPYIYIILLTLPIFVLWISAVWALIKSLCIKLGCCTSKDDGSIRSD